MYVEPQENVSEEVRLMLKEETTRGICKKEYYLDFKENLSFDQLCESLSNLFIKFYEYYRKGEEIRIIDHLNEMKIGPFS